MEITHGLFLEINDAIARAQSAVRSGEPEESVKLLGEARTLIEENGLTGHISIQKMPHPAHAAIRLCGPDGGGISYIISKEGVSFP